MVAWQTLPLGDVLTFQRGFDITKDEQREGPYSVISSSGPKSLHAEFKVRGPGVIIGRKGSLGTVFYSDSNFWPHDTTLWVKNFHGNSPQFAYYFLQTMGFERLDAGASNPSLNRNHIHTIPVLWPPLPTQQRIAGILSAYDDLIENSQRRIKILEAMARALYREWFVRFRFPGHENHPRVPSPLGEIPQGWEVRTLAELCSRMESGGTPKRSNPEYWEDGNIDWYKTGELWDGFLFDSQEKITARGQSESTARLFEQGTIVMAIYGSPTVGRLGILTHQASCNQAALGLVANKALISQCYLYFVLFSLRAHFNSLAQGAAQQNISKEKVASALAIMPTREFVELFDSNIEPVFTQIQTLQRKVNNLHRTRYLLLPRLLSGQIDVEAA